MSSSPVSSKRVRGYRIHVYRGAGHRPPSYTTPLVWREQVPLAEWQRIIADPATLHAWIIQSGRKMRQFEFRRSDSPWLPLVEPVIPSFPKEEDLWSLTVSI